MLTALRTQGGSAIWRREGGRGSVVQWIGFKYQPEHVHSLCDLRKDVPEVKGSRHPVYKEGCGTESWLWNLFALQSCQMHLNLFPHEKLITLEDPCKNLARSFMKPSTSLPQSRSSILGTWCSINKNWCLFEMRCHYEHTSAIIPNGYCWEGKNSGIFPLCLPVQLLS